MGLVSLLLVGCSVQFPDPSVVAVAPDRGWFGEENRVEIRGTNFYPLVHVDARTGDGQIDDEFIVQLVGPVEGEDSGVYDLVGVDWYAYTQLLGTVPEGLPIGQYDLLLEGPTGLGAALPLAYTVTETKADHLDVSTEFVEYEVNTEALLELQLLDPTDLPVLEPFDFILEVIPDAGPLDMVFDLGSIDNAEVIDATTISGTLDTSGAGQVGLTLVDPGTVTVELRPMANSGPDASVDPDDERILFSPGSDLELDILLPGGAASYSTTAGEPFDVTLQLTDQNGFPVDNATETVVLRNTCGPNFTSLVTVNGRATTTVTLTQASSTANCLVDRLVSGGFSVPGESADIHVEAGSLVQFNVLAPVPSVVAGDPDALVALVTPVDAFENTTKWNGGAVQLADSVGGLVTQPDDCDTTGSLFFCETTATIAGEGIVLTVQDDGGIQGDSNAYTVLPAAADTVVVEAQGTSTVAGASLAVAVSVFDEFGNLLRSQDLPEAAFEFSAADEVPVCNLSSAPIDDRVWFDCVLTVARPDAAVDVTLTSSSLTGRSAPIAVENGPLSVVDISHPGSAVAGEPLLIDFAGYDAFGNPYLVQTDAVVSVTDTSGTLSIASVTLDNNGQATATASFTKAGATVVWARQAGGDLGTSSSLMVSASTATVFGVVAPPWSWLGTPEDITLRALDAFGNQANYDGDVTVTSASGNVVGEPLTVALSAGQGTASVEWTAASLNEVLSADDGALSGSSSTIAVVIDCGVGASPTVDLDFGGFAQAIVCFNDTAGEGTILGLLDGSAPISGHSIDLFALAVDGGDSARDGTGSDLRVFVDAVGRYDVLGLVVQDDSCATEAQGVAWVGPDDGSPVGPIDVSPVSATIDVGVQTTSIDISGAVDCSRDAAAGGRVFVRSNRGDVLVPAGETGLGLAVTLDAAGDGQFELDAVGTLSGGEATVTAWLDHPAGGGTSTVTLIGDDRNPVVWEQSPRGDTVGGVGIIDLWFSEPMLPGAVQPVGFSVTGPSAVQVVAATLVEPDHVELTLDGPVTSDAGVWTVSTSSVRDAGGGNPIDGAHSGVASPYNGSFGDLPSTAGDVIDCTPDVATFRPDGDDGLGAQTDFLRVDLESQSTPARWIVSVEDSGGTLVYRDHKTAVDAVDSWTWDGRDVTEKIVDNGTWTLRFEADDGFGNRGAECVTSVTVDNREAP